MSKGQLNDWLVNTAMGVSYQLWMEANQAYAIQLEAEGDVIKSASTWLLIHRVEEAIRTLSKAKQYRCAISVAR